MIAATRDPIGGSLHAAPRSRSRTRVAVLGAGLQGACAALELAAAGARVDLYEKHDRCVTQASAQNEGKIHLGYVYAADDSLRTARTMVRGAIAFAPLMRRWLGDALDAVPVSSPFYYVVHRAGLLGADEVERHLRAAHAIALEESGARAPDYFGSTYRVAPRRLSAPDADALFDPRETAAAFATHEIGIDPEALAALVRARLAAETRIRILSRATVRAVDRSGAAPVVHADIDGAPARERYDHVVNTLWDGRLAVDLTAGLRPPRPWMYRAKHYLRLRAPSVAGAIPSATIVLGPFGDIAAYGDGEYYLSWYPAGMRAASSELSPPAWALTLNADEQGAMDRAIRDGLRRVVPSIAALDSGTVTSRNVKGGIICAWGETDVDDRRSGLHERHAIGLASHGRYHTIDTGKLTMAPFFGRLVAQRIRQSR